MKWGASYDDTLGEEVRVTLIATGYPVTDIPGIESAEEADAAQAADFNKEVVITKQPTIEEAMEVAYGTALQKSDEPEVSDSSEEPENVETSESSEKLEKQETPEPAQTAFPDEDPSNVITFSADDLDETISLSETEELQPEEDEQPAWKRRRPGGFFSFRR